MPTTLRSVYGSGPLVLCLCRVRTPYRHPTMTLGADTPDLTPPTYGGQERRKNVAAVRPRPPLSGRCYRANECCDAKQDFFGFCVDIWIASTLYCDLTARRP